MENIENYSTVPKYVINKIRNLSLGKDLQKQLMQLKEEYPDPEVKVLMESHEPVYILAVENRL